MTCAGDPTWPDGRHAACLLAGAAGTHPARPEGSAQAALSMARRERLASTPPR